MASGKRKSQPIRLALSSKFNVEPIAQINMTPPHSRRSREYLRLIASKSRIGRVKRAVGELTDDDKLKREGTIDKATGKAKDVADKVADKTKDTVGKNT